MSANDVGAGIPSLRDTLLAQIDAFCQEWRMTRTQFGIHAMNDATFVTRLKGGSNIGINSVDKARRFIATYRGPSGAKQ